MTVMAQYTASGDVSVFTTTAKKLFDCNNAFEINVADLKAADAKAAEICNKLGIEFKSPVIAYADWMTDMGLDTAELRKRYQEECGVSGYSTPQEISSVADAQTTAVVTQQNTEVATEPQTSVADAAVDLEKDQDVIRFRKALNEFLSTLKAQTNTDAEFSSTFSGVNGKAVIAGMVSGFMSTLPERFSDEKKRYLSGIVEETVASFAKEEVQQQEQPQQQQSQQQNTLPITSMKELEVVVTAMEKFIASGNIRVNMGTDLNVSMKAVKNVAVAVDHNLNPTFVCLDYIEAGDVEGTCKVFSLEIKGEEDETGVFTIRKLVKGPQVVLVANHQLAKFKDAVIQNHNLWVNGSERTDITAEMIGGNIGILTMLGGDSMFAL